MYQRAVPPNMRATYQALIHKNQGTGTIKDLPFGCAVSFQGRNWTVGGYDEILDVTTLRLVNRDCSIELSLVPADQVVKATASQWQR